MMVFGVISRRRSRSFLSQPARGGSRMTVWLGSMKERQSSDLARKAFGEFEYLFLARGMMVRFCALREAPFVSPPSSSPSLRVSAAIARS